LVVEGGEGAIVRGVDGNEYIDFNSGIAVLNVGHACIGGDSIRKLPFFGPFAGNKLFVNSFLAH
jgi:hypothetical protein